MGVPTHSRTLVIPIDEFGMHHLLQEKLVHWEGGEEWNLKLLTISK